MGRPSSCRSYGRLLVDAVVQPVGEQQVAVRAPADDRRLRPGRRRGSSCGASRSAARRRGRGGTRCRGCRRRTPAWPVTNTRRPSRDAARYTPASGETASSSRSGSARMSSMLTVVCRECGARNTSSKPRVILFFGSVTSWGTLRRPSRPRCACRSRSGGRARPGRPSRWPGWRTHARQPTAMIPTSSSQ